MKHLIGVFEMTFILQIKRNLRLTILFAIASVIISGCSSSRKRSIDYHKWMLPPNTVKLSDNFYCDKTEVTNIDWREYMFWAKRVFGENSIEYIATLPDTMVWRQDFDCLESYVQNYFQHPVYNFYPLVGVTQQQVNGYSKWRSDRVFELLLINRQIIKPDAAQNRETYFTIEKYFKGTLNKIKPDEKIKYYPEFRLPTLAERNKMMTYLDSVDLAYLNKCTTKYCKECKSYYPTFHSDVIPCGGDTLKMELNLEDYKNCVSKNVYPIYNLRGNVSEWIMEENVAAGGSWHDKRDNILKKDTAILVRQNAWTGFRNVCEWKQWTE